MNPNPNLNLNNTFKKKNKQKMNQMPQPQSLISAQQQFQPIPQVSHLPMMNNNYLLTPEQLQQYQLHIQAAQAAQAQVQVQQQQAQQQIQMQQLQQKLYNGQLNQLINMPHIPIMNVNNNSTAIPINNNNDILNSNPDIIEQILDNTNETNNLINNIRQDLFDKLHSIEMAINNLNPSQIQIASTGTSTTTTTATDDTDSVSVIIDTESSNEHHHNNQNQGINGCTLCMDIQNTLTTCINTINQLEKKIEQQSVSSTIELKLNQDKISTLEHTIEQNKQQYLIDIENERKLSTTYKQQLTVLEQELTSMKNKMLENKHIYDRTKNELIQKYNNIESRFALDIRNKDFEINNLKKQLDAYKNEIKDLSKTCTSQERKIKDLEQYKLEIIESKKNSIENQETNVTNTKSTSSSNSKKKSKSANSPNSTSAAAASAVTTANEDNFINEAIIDNLNHEIQQLQAEIKRLKDDVELYNKNWNEQMKSTEQAMKRTHTVQEEKQKLNENYIQMQNTVNYIVNKYNDAKIISSTTYEEAIQALNLTKELKEDTSELAFESKMKPITISGSESGSNVENTEQHMDYSNETTLKEIACVISNIVRQNNIPIGSSSSNSQTTDPIQDHIPCIQSKLKALGIIDAYTETHGCIKLAFLKLLAYRSKLFNRIDDLERIYQHQVDDLSNRLSAYQAWIYVNKYNVELTSKFSIDSKVIYSVENVKRHKSNNGLANLTSNFNLNLSSTTTPTNDFTFITATKDIKPGEQVKSEDFNFQQLSLDNIDSFKASKFIEITYNKYRKIYQAIRVIANTDYMFFYKFLLPTISQDDQNILYNMVKRHELIV